MLKHSHHYSIAEDRHISVLSDFDIQVVDRAHIQAEKRKNTAVSNSTCTHFAQSQFDSQQHSILTSVATSKSDTMGIAMQNMLSALVQIKTRFLHCQDFFFNQNVRAHQ